MCTRVSPHLHAMKILTGFCLLCSIFAVSYADVLALTTNDFHDVVDGKIPAFVEFYAPWCGHCKKLAPEYDLVGKAFQKKSSEVIVAKVDCTAETELCSEYGVTGYPTLKYFPQDFTEPEAYQGGRTAEDIVNFITTKTGVRGKLSIPKSHVVATTSADFDKVALDESKDVLMEFYAPWCGHCKALAPTWEELAKVFQLDEDVVIAKLDSDSYRETAATYDISGYPTIKFFPRDGKDVEEYSGGRDLESLVEFVNEKAGLERLPSGRLKPSAGRVSSIDKLAQTFGDAKDKESVIEEAKRIISESTGISPWVAKVYLRAFENAAKDSGYVDREILRLEGMVSGGSVTLAKQDEFVKRINILSAFSSKTLEATEEASD